MRILFSLFFAMISFLSSAQKTDIDPYTIKLDPKSKEDSIFFERVKKLYSKYNFKKMDSASLNNSTPVKGNVTRMHVTRENIDSIEQFLEMFKMLASPESKRWADSMDQANKIYYMKINNAYKDSLRQDSIKRNLMPARPDNSLHVLPYKS